MVKPTYIRKYVNFVCLNNIIEDRIVEIDLSSYIRILTGMRAHWDADSAHKKKFHNKRGLQK